MEIIKKEPKETISEYCARVYNIKEALGLTWDDIAFIINTELGYNYSSDKYRKDSYKLNKATYTDIGTISIDGNTVIINEADQISINNYSELMSGLASLDSELSDELNELNEIKNEILSQIK